MIDIMSPLITEADNLTTPLLDLILINIVEPQKSANINAYHLAEQLIQETSYALEPIIKIVRFKYIILYIEKKLISFFFSSFLTKSLYWVKSTKILRLQQKCMISFTNYIKLVRI